MEELIEEARKYAKDKELFDEYVGHENPETVRTFLQDAVQKLREGKVNNLEELYSLELKEFLGLEEDIVEEAREYNVESTHSYEVTPKELAITSKKYGIGAKMIGKIKELFSKIRHHDTDIGGR